MTREEWLEYALRDLLNEAEKTLAWRACKGAKPATDTSEFAYVPPSVVLLVVSIIKQALRNGEDDSWVSGLPSNLLHELRRSQSSTESP